MFYLIKQVPVEGLKDTYPKSLKDYEIQEWKEF